MHKDQLEIIQNVLKILNDAPFPKSSIATVLEILRDRFFVRRSFLFAYQKENDKLNLLTANGLSATEFRRLESKAEKSLFRRVFESEKLTIVSRISLEPTLDFLRTSDAETSLIALPIVLDGRIIGVFAAEFTRQSNFALENYAMFLIVIAQIIAQAFKTEAVLSVERERLAKENQHLRQELREKYDFGQIIGNSGLMRQVYDQVTQVARSNATVLLRGEMGTGKEMIAQAIHYNSLRSKKPFVKINCAALPDSLIESELFGYEKGAFAGADKLKKGRFESAEGGTLFLDEIGDLPVPTQVKLLRVIQEKKYERFGSTASVKTNVRLIAATNKNLENEIASGKFREDLFYRLNVFTIFLPPLRERKSDILLLAEHFLEKYEREHGKKIKRISTPAIDMLTAYHFPGNVRELENAVERAVLVCEESVIHGHHLPPTLQTAEISGTAASGSLVSAVEAFERDLIADTLKSTRGNVAKAARILDSTERILGYKIKKYQIDAARFKK